MSSRTLRLIDRGDKKIIRVRLDKETAKCLTQL